MTQINQKTIDNAVATLVSADTERAKIDTVYAQSTRDADNAYAKAQQRAKHEYDSAGANVASTLGVQVDGARAAAEQLAGQEIGGFEYGCQQRGIIGSDFGGNPRTMQELAEEIGQLKNSWEHIDELNALEMALRAEPKPWLLWGWLGLTGVGTVAMVVFASLAN